jgi:hypothetical protein
LTVRRGDKSKYPAGRGARDGQYWSGRVTRESNALDLEAGIFGSDDPERIARSLEGSATASRRRKAGPLQSAMSMLTFYINPRGPQPAARKAPSSREAKEALRRLYGRE